MLRTLEVPIDSIEGARLAAPFATRLEVCHDLSTEGWTPKMDLVRACREVVEGTSCTLVAMIRPEFPGCSRALDVAAFTATPKLLDLCLREIEAAAHAGAHSVGVSLLTPDGLVDIDANARLIAHARSFGLVVAFLRTYDLLVDRERGMRDLSALGFTRFITAGVLGWDASVATLDERIAVVARDVAGAESRGHAPRARADRGDPRRRRACGERAALAGAFAAPARVVPPERRDRARGTRAPARRDALTCAHDHRAAPRVACHRRNPPGRRDA